MKITAITPQVKQPDRYSVYVDGVFVFGLSEAALVKSGLHSGRTLSAQDLAELKDMARQDKGYNRVLVLISRRPRSEWEVRDYLRRKEYEPDAIEAIVARAVARGYVDDVAFARMWVENRRLLKPTSRRKLVQELRQKRVPGAVIDQVLHEDEQTIDEQAVLRQLIAKKRSRYPDQTKLMQYLARQGYGYDDIKAALADE